MRYFLFFLLLFNGCNSPEKQSNVSFKPLTLQSSFEKSFSSVQNSISYLDFEKKLSGMPDATSNLLRTNLYGISIGDNLDSFEPRKFSFKKIGNNKFIREHYQSGNEFDHEIEIVGNHKIEGVKITFFAPQILSNYQPPIEPLELLKYNQLFVKNNYTYFKDSVNHLQQLALNELLFYGWWLQREGGYLDYPPTFIETNYKNAFNSFSDNLIGAWVENEIVTLVGFCTPDYGSSVPAAIEYFQNLSDYNSYKKKYPILRCLIISVKEINNLKFSLWGFINNSY